MIIFQYYAFSIFGMRSIFIEIWGSIFELKKIPGRNKIGFGKICFCGKLQNMIEFHGKVYTAMLNQHCDFKNWFKIENHDFQGSKYLLKIMIFWFKINFQSRNVDLTLPCTLFHETLSCSATFHKNKIFPKPILFCPGFF